MATLNDLTAAINALLDHPLGANQYQLANQVAPKAYEAYIFGLCLRAIRQLKATPILRGIQGTPTPFVFRGSPGKIHAATKNYGYARFSINGQEFEIHAGVEFKGTSGITHELDVCIMRAEDADNCRPPATRNDPSAASLIGGWECKFYDKRLEKVLGRAFVGLMDDMGTNIRLNGLCSNKTYNPLKDFFRPQRRPYAHFELTPLETDNENVFVMDIVRELKKMTGL